MQGSTRGLVRHDGSLEQVQPHLIETALKWFFSPSIRWIARTLFWTSYPIVTSIRFIDPGFWGGIGPATFLPLSVIDVTPFCTEFGFCTVILYVAPRHCRTTSNSFQSCGMQGSTTNPSKCSLTPSIHWVAAMYAQPPLPVSHGWRARQNAVWSFPIMNWQ